MIDVNIILSKLNSCTNDPDFDLFSFFTCHGVENDDVPLTCEDVILHFLNGQCVERKAPGCSEVTHGVQSPIKMALTITETIVTQCECKQILLDDLHVWCSAIGVTATQRPEYATLVQKLKIRCNALWPLLNCDGLDTIFCGVETLGKQSLQHLGVQHNVNVNSNCNANSTKTAIIDHVTSGGCRASTSSLCTLVNDKYHESALGSSGDLETYVLQLATKKGKLSKKALRRVLKSRDIEFSDDGNVGKLLRHLCSHLTRLRKGKQPEWARNRRDASESEYNSRLNEIRDEWPQPAPLDLKEDCVRNFHAATSSESLRQFTCACCAENIVVSDQKMRRLEEIDLELMRDRTDRVLDESCIPPEPPFTVGPLANLMIDPNSITQDSENEISLQLCVCCDSSLQNGKLPRLAV